MVPAVERCSKAREFVAGDELVAVHVLQLAVGFHGIEILEYVGLEGLARLHRGSFSEGFGAARLVEPNVEDTSEGRNPDKFSGIGAGDVVAALFEPFGLLAFVLLGFDEFHF